ncbi:MAG: hypothetical protein GY794_10090 [bacterium]|nr:hypothetical protein [bacterium]
MAELTSTERVMRVLRREEPDRVPHFEWLISKQVCNALVPGCKGHNDFAIKMGHDAIMVSPDFTKEQIGPTEYMTEWGFSRDYGLEEHGIEVHCPIQTMEDFLAWSPPDPHAPGRYDTIEKAVAEWKGKMAIGVHLNDVFSIPRSLMSMTSILMAVMTDPGLVSALVKMSVEVNIEMAREVARRGADFVWTGDDYAFNSGPFMSPDSFRELFYPGLCEVSAGFKDAGLPFIKHCDGNIWPIVDMMIDSGITALDPIDQQGGMDLGEVKAKFGDRVAIKGNVDCAETMTNGSVEDMIVATKAALKTGMPGGGYICSSSNSIHSAVKPENYKAMLDTIKEFGTYPCTL